MMNFKQLLNFTNQMTKQTCIDELIETFMNRLEYLIDIDDYASADAIHSEFVVNGIEPEHGEYIWLFVPNLSLY